MGKINNLEEWHKIGDKLTSYFGICGCQRKLKTIIDNLYEIFTKCKERNYEFTGAEWLVLAMMDAKYPKQTAVCHGTNCEYPIVMKNDEFWQWICEVKDSLYLEDN